MHACEHCGYKPGLLKKTFGSIKSVIFCSKCGKKLVVQGKCQDDLILANYVPDEDNNLHKRTRKGEIIMSDILSFMIHSSPASLPVFVAADLSKIPLVPVDKIDAMALFREMQKLKTEMQVMKADLANAAAQRGQLATQMKNVSERQSSQHKVIKSKPTEAPKVKSFAAVVKQTTNVQPAKPVPTKAANSDDVTTCSRDNDSKSEEPESSSKVAQEDTGSTSDSDEDGFQLQRAARRKRAKYQRGTGVNVALKARPPPPYKMYLGNMSAETTVEDIIEYIKTVKNFEIEVSKLKGKRDDCSSFVISCNKIHQTDICDLSIWPQSAVIRKFFMPRNGKMSS